MGKLVDGQWTPSSVITNKGQFVRKATSFRSWIRADGSTAFGAESGRYHLYVSAACPWAHRTIIFRALKNLENHVSVTVVSPLMFEEGWELTAGDPDPIHGVSKLYELYQQADAQYTGRVTVPVLWDKNADTMVSNESSEIIRMLDRELGPLGGTDSDHYPEALREEIDAINERIYDTVNNGVYRCGFAGTQEAYDSAFVALFDTLDMVEARLGERRYLCGGRITEADWRLFTTLIRFDAVYYTHFKCNKRRIVDYPNLDNYLRELYQWPKVADTVDLAQIKQHYYRCHESINPKRIVPQGPALDWTAPHDRARLPSG